MVLLLYSCYYFPPFPPLLREKMGIRVSNFHYAGPTSNATNSNDTNPMNLAIKTFVGTSMETQSWGPPKYPGRHYQPYVDDGGGFMSWEESVQVRPCSVANASDELIHMKYEIEKCALKPANPRILHNCSYTTET